MIQAKIIIQFWFPVLNYFFLIKCAGADRRGRFGANTGDTGFVEGKKGRRATRSRSSWKFDIRDKQFSITDQENGTKSRERVSWKSSSESTSRRLEAIRQVLLLSRWQAATRRSSSPCEFLLFFFSKTEKKPIPIYIACNCLKIIRFELLLKDS